MPPTVALEGFKSLVNHSHSLVGLGQAGTKHGILVLHCKIFPDNSNPTRAQTKSPSPTRAQTNQQVLDLYHLQPEVICLMSGVGWEYLQ